MGLFPPTLAEAQTRVQERGVPAHAIPPAPSGEYEPCFWVGSRRTSMCLSDRQRYVDSLRSARFFSDSLGGCKLVFPEMEEPVVYSCGTLVVGVRSDLSEEASAAILTATGGEWRLEPYLRGLVLPFEILKVAPGTERSSLYNIIFHPAVRWVDFSRFHRGEIYEEPRSLLSPTDWSEREGTPSRQGRRRTVGTGSLVGQGAVWVRKIRSQREAGIP